MVSQLSDIIQKEFILYLCVSPTSSTASFVVFLYEFIVCTIFSLVIHVIVAIPVKLFTGKTPEFVAPNIQPPLPLRVFTKVMKVLDLFTDGLQSLVTFLQGTTNRRVNSDNRSQSGRHRGSSVSSCAFLTGSTRSTHTVAVAVSWVIV